MNNNTLTALVLAALDDSAIKALNERVNELAELGFKPQIVDELPAEGNDHTLYLVPQSEPGEDPWYYEYLWLDDEWEKIGTTSVNFDDYYKKAEIDTILEDYSTWEDVESIREQLEDSIDAVSDRVDDLEENTYTKSEVYNKDEIDSTVSDINDSIDAVTSDVSDLADKLDDNYYTKDETYNKDEVDQAISEIDLSNYLAKDNTTAYTPTAPYHPATKEYVDEVGRQLFDGTSEEWEALTEEQKIAFVMAAVEDYVELDIADTYNINEAIGDTDPQEPVVSDLYEDEALDLTNQIIGGGE